jgi:hypothetical protein
MQALLDIYRMAVNLDDKDLISLSEAVIGRYYEKLYSR